MDRWHYLLILAACLAVTLPLEPLLGLRVRHRVGRLAATVLPVAVVFAGWDLLAYRGGHWWFSDRYTLGPRLAGLPAEEWLFFLVVPVCAVLAYESVNRVLDRRRERRDA